MNYFEGLNFFFILLTSPAATIFYAIGVGVLYAYFLIDYFDRNGFVRRATKFWIFAGLLVVWVLALNHTFFVLANFENKLGWVAV